MFMNLIFAPSYLLYTLSKPDVHGNPTVDISEDNTFRGSSLEKKLNLVLIKATMKSSHFRPLPSIRLRSVLKAKLWRMGKSLARQNSRQRKQVIERWQKSSWDISFKPTEIRSSLIAEKNRLADELETLKEQNEALQSNVTRLESTKVTMENDLESVIQENRSLQEGIRKEREQNEKLQERLDSAKDVHVSKPSRKRKSWEEYSGRHKKRKIQALKERAVNILNDDQFEVCKLEVRNKDDGSSSNIDICVQETDKENVSCQTAKQQVLYTKERYGISDQAYHELSMVDESLPRSWMIKHQRNEMNKQWEISRTPGECNIGVQQSFKKKLIDRIRVLEQKAPSDACFRQTSIIRVKLTGDGTYIGPRQHIVTFGFTVLDEGSAAKSFAGNHTVCIIRGPENYDSLSTSLKDVIEEITEIHESGLEIDTTTYAIHFYLGADWKFLAMACGIDAANSTHACVWCTCSKDDRHKLSKEWSICDQSKGARTVQSITDALKLPARSKQKFNCSKVPLFPMVPMERVVIDNLHLFLRVADNLINLLILDLCRIDGIEKCTQLDRDKATNIREYESFLSATCKIPFHFYVCKDSKSLKWRDLTGPEKYKLFLKVNLPDLFPNLPNASTIQEIWTKFMELNTIIRLETISVEESTTFAAKSKAWLQLYLTVYQTKHVTPYIHALVAHLHEFFQIHGAIVPFTQQGLEKLNDVYTHYYFKSTNHHEFDSLKQLLLKKNRLETLADMGCERKKKVQTCSICKKSGHNKRKCTISQ